MGVNGVCVDDTECNAGLTCLDKKCEKQIELGKNCTTTNSCVNNGACYDGKCISY